MLFRITASLSFTITIVYFSKIQIFPARAGKRRHPFGIRFDAAIQYLFN